MLCVVVLDGPLPLTPNGKLDHSALPPPGRPPAGRPPATPREELLCRLMAEILELDGVGADEDFFAAGGDSLVAIRLVRAAREHGLRFAARDVLTARTAEALAAVAVQVGEAQASDPDAGHGEVPLTPILHWICGAGGPIEHYCQAVLVQVPPDAGAGRLQAALDAVVARHDLLRAQLAQVDGTWRMQVPHGEGPTVERVDAAGWPGARLRAAVTDRARRAQAALDPAAGAVLHAVWFDRGTGHAGRLLLVAHHAVVDWVSWGIVLGDLESAWRGRPPAPVPTPFRTWARALTVLAPARRNELPSWRAQLRPGSALPLRRPLDRAVDTMGTCTSVRTVLDGDVTRALLGTRITEALVAGLAMAVRECFGGPLSVMVEGHGRAEHVLAGADLSRTVGWFTALRPVHVDIGDTGPAAALARATTALAADPDDGIGFGLLRHLDPETAAELASHPVPPIELNYLGRFSRPEARDWAFAPEMDAVDVGAPAGMPATYPLSIVARTEDRAEGPSGVAEWIFPAGVLAQEQVAALAAAWTEALAAIAPEA